MASNKNSVVARFAGILGRAIAENGDDDGAVDVELVYPPLHTRMMNVVNRPPTARYEVAPGLPSTTPEAGRPIRLPLTDLFVGLNAAHALRLYSKRLGRELRIHQTHMLAWQRLAPPVAHAIAVIAGDGVRASSTTASSSARRRGACARRSSAAIRRNGPRSSSLSCERSGASRAT